MVLLLPAIFLLAIQNPLGMGGQGSARVVQLSLVALNLACLAMNLFQTGSFWFFWVSPALLVLYFARMSRAYHPRMHRGPQAVAVSI
jgi:hypothetical protein